MRDFAEFVVLMSATLLAATAVSGLGLGLAELIAWLQRAPTSLFGSFGLTVTSEADKAGAQVISTYLARQKSISAVSDFSELGYFYVQQVDKRLRVLHDIFGSM